MNMEMDGYLERLHFDAGSMVRDGNSCTIKMCKDREILSFCDKNCHNSCGPTGVFDVVTCTWNCDSVCKPLYWKFTNLKTNKNRSRKVVIKIENRATKHFYFLPDIKAGSARDWHLNLEVIRLTRHSLKSSEKEKSPFPKLLFFTNFKLRRTVWIEIPFWN